MNADKNISFDKLRKRLKMPQPSSELSKNNKLLKVGFSIKKSIINKIYQIFKI